MRFLLANILMMVATVVSGQGLFESAASEVATSGSATLNYELGGYVRGGYVMGEALLYNNEWATQSVYSEAALKLYIDKEHLGKAYGEVRFRAGAEYEQKFSEIDIREAYVKTDVYDFDFTLGKQIIVWGRADGFNPTNVLAPQNMLARSPNEDDKRFGNWMATTSYSVNKFRFDAIFVPIYESWLVPFELLEQTGMMGTASFGEDMYPDYRLKNSSYALKINYLGHKVDGSISYFHGYNPKPGIASRLIDSKAIIHPIAYGIDMLGADFSTIVGRYGWRGEFAYSRPTDDVALPYIPNSDLQFVFGLDRSFGSLQVIVQYFGRYVFDFVENKPPSDPTDDLAMAQYGLETKNRIFASQLYDFSNTATVRLGYKLFHETGDANILGMYNFNTEELMIRPKVSYQMTDAMECTLGAEVFTGPDDTLYGLIGDIVTGAFVEMKVSF